MGIILLTLWSIVVLFFLFSVFVSNRLYCYIFEHSDYMFFQKLIKEDISEFKKMPKVADCAAICFRYKGYEIICWKKTKTASIHRGLFCIPDFDKYNSKKLYKKLMGNENK